MDAVEAAREGRFLNSNRTPPWVAHLVQDPISVRGPRRILGSIEQVATSAHARQLRGAFVSSSVTCPDASH